MIYVLIPIYNEEDNIENLVRSFDEVNQRDQLFFVFSDDGSKDNSTALLALKFKDDPHVILGDGSNNGPGYAFNTGFEWILANAKNDDDIIVTMEADTTSDIAIFSDMIAVNKLGYNLVMASVYAQGGSFDKTTFFRKFISSIANLFFRFYFDIEVLTLSSFYRCYSLSLVKSIKEKHGKVIAENNFICMLEVLVKAIKCDAKIIEIPMILRSQNRVGKSKMKVLKNAISYCKFLLKSR